MKKIIFFIIAVLFLGLNSCGSEKKTSSSKQKTYVVVYFAVEDYIVPEKENIDGIPKWLAETMTEVGVPGTFCVIGKKARVLERRGRQDVIDAMGKHDIGMHTNYGSIHPTITEMLENSDWETGVEKMIQNEFGGIEDIERVFNKPVSIFARHGGSYGPQLVYALGEKGIGYATSPVFLPNHNPIWFCNNLNFSAVNIYNKFDNVYYKDDLFNPVFEKMKEEFPKMIEQNRGGVIALFGAHPCKIRSKQFWDINYYKGVNTDSTEWVIPDLRPQSSMITARKNFKRLMEYLKEMKNVELVTYKDLMKQFSYQAEYVNKNELQKIAKQIVTQKSIIISNNYSPAEIFNSLVQSILEYKQNGKLPKKVKLASPLGPLEMPTKVPEVSQVFFAKVFDLATTAESIIKITGHLPSSLVLEKKEIGLGSLLSLFSHVYLDIISNSQKSIYAIEAFEQYPKENIDAILTNVKKLKSWPIHRPDLDMTHLVKMTQLQMWTIKPAIEK